MTAIEGRWRQAGTITDNIGVGPVAEVGTGYHPIPEQVPNPMLRTAPESRLKFIDLFAGLGGFHSGLAGLGHRCALACEIDEELRRLYAVNHGLEPTSDVRGLAPSDVPAHEVLCAGFPCQPFSKAGEQLGLDCERDGDLFNHIVRILRTRRPSFIILENVANLLRHRDGETYGWMRGRLESLGYEIKEQVLSPHQFGIPQIRERAFIVGALHGLDHFDWPAPSTAEPAITSVLDKRPRGARTLPAHYVRCIEVWQEFLDRIPRDAPLPSFPIWSFEFGATYPFDDLPPALVDPRVLAKSRGAFGESLVGLSHEERLARIPSYSRGANPFPRWKRNFIAQNRAFFEEHRTRLRGWLPKIRDFAPSLQKLEWNCKTAPRRLSEHILQFRASGVRVKRSNWAPALVAMTTTQVPVITWEQRYMTVKECARLQGLGDLSFEGLAPSRAFRAIGNAVSADLVRLIGSNLLHSAERRVRHRPALVGC